MSFALKGTGANSFGILLPNSVVLKRTQEESHHLMRSCANDSERKG